jgi:DUF4097 and DUF4098 domain-containing protein YvlB
VAQEKWLVDGPKVIDIENVRNLKVSLIRGQVNIVAHDEPTTRLEVHSVKGKDLKISIDGDTLEIDHPQLSWDNFVEVFTSFRGTASTDVSILVPRDVRLKFGVVSATSLVSGLAQDAKISTVSGDLVIDDLRGDLELNTVGGEVSVRGHHGAINANSVSGDLTASGEISRLSADTVSGNVFLDLKGIPDQVKVNTVSGSVTTRLENEAPARYRIHTVSGKLQLDGSSFTGVRGAFTSTYGELDKHWLDFSANTVSGNVSVLHTAEA